MKILLVGWIVIGSLINLYYHVKNANKYSKLLSSGQASIGQFVLGGILTHLLWPVTIYNQEFRLKKKRK